MSGMGRIGWLVAAMDFVIIIALVIWGISRENVVKDLRGQLEQAQATAQAEQEKTQDVIKELKSDLAKADDDLAALKAELVDLKQKAETAAKAPEASAEPSMAEAFAKMLGGQGKPAEGENANPMAGMAAMFEGEKGEALMDMSVQTQLNMMYGDYFNEAQLSPEKQQQAKSILSEYQKEAMRIGLDAMQGKIDAAAAQAKMAELDKTLRAQMGSVLTPVEMSTWETYEANKSANMVSKGIDMQLGMMAPGLTSESRELARQTITEELLATGADFSNPTGQASGQNAQLDAFQRARDRLSTSLEPDQLSQVDAFIQQMESMTKLQQQMMQPKKN